MSALGVMSLGVMSLGVMSLGVMSGHPSKYSKIECYYRMLEKSLMFIFCSEKSVCGRGKEQGKYSQ